jgi:hypothetical protein
VREIAQDAIMAGGGPGSSDTITQLENQRRHAFYLLQLTTYMTFAAVLMMFSYACTLPQYADCNIVVYSAGTLSAFS